MTEDFYLLCDSDRLSHIRLRIRLRSRDIGGLREIASIAPAATKPSVAEEDQLATYAQSMCARGAQLAQMSEMRT